ncbi:LOW QUALITY PROTEIN: hypothetical protein PHMEG_00024280 [Phytophthora megakarya]|uniref:Eukaryotic/viral aspartic protease n=1 Tax=Phytophthora megakarya TaxID=4795 RepID=A0A225VHC9_9STRA|nr:LOW QUALITY PROTEIN: hypothetical protein PHMEG_00024280 [Phytophthora megakarya]
MSNFEQQLKKREEEWKLEREAMATGMQNQLLTVLQAALSQIAPHPATGIQSESLSPPDSATLNPVRAFAAKNSQTPIVGASPTVASVQLRVAVDQKREIKHETPPVKSATRRQSSNASQTYREANGVASCEEDCRAERSQPKKAKEQSDPPPDDPDDSEPSDSDNEASPGGNSDSNDAEDFSGEDEDIGMTTTTTTADGTTIGIASSDNRVNWWERFSDMASQGSWSDTMKIRQFRSQMPTAIRDWFTQLPKYIRHDWKQMSRRFRKLYIGTTGSYSERYFTMKKTDNETPLQFFYCLNAATVKAEVKFKSSSKLRESHIRRFIKKLRNDQLKTALEGHRFQSITGLERALRRHEDVWREEGYDSPAPKKLRDFRARKRSPRPVSESWTNQTTQSSNTSLRILKFQQRRTQSRSKSFPVVELMEKCFESQRTNNGSHPTHNRVKVQHGQRIGTSSARSAGSGDTLKSTDTRLDSVPEPLVPNVEGFPVEYRVNSGKLFSQ